LKKSFRGPVLERPITLRAFADARFSLKKRRCFGVAGRQNAWLMSHTRGARGAAQKPSEGEKDGEGKRKDGGASL
jgi:hypothetical protein